MKFKLFPHVEQVDNSVAGGLQFDNHMDDIRQIEAVSEQTFGVCGYR